MGKNQYSYPPEYRVRMVGLVRAGSAPMPRCAASPPPRIVRESPVVTQYGVDIGIPRQHPGVGQEAAVHRAARAQAAYVG